MLQQQKHLECTTGSSTGLQVQLRAQEVHSLLGLTEQVICRIFFPLVHSLLYNDDNSDNTSHNTVGCVEFPANYRDMIMKSSCLESHISAQMVF